MAPESRGYIRGKGASPMANAQIVADLHLSLEL